MYSLFSFCMLECFISSTKSNLLKNCDAFKTPPAVLNTRLKTDNGKAETSFNALRI